MPRDLFELAGGLLRFAIRADEDGRTTFDLDACTCGSVGGAGRESGSTGFGAGAADGIRSIWVGLEVSKGWEAAPISGCLGRTLH